MSLPLVDAILNASSAMLLCAGLAAIKSGRGGMETPPERKREHELVASTQRKAAPPAPVAPAARSGSIFQSMFYPAPSYYGRQPVYR